MARTNVTRVLLVLAVSLVSLGCASILGIEEATCDPDFDEACEAGTSTFEDDDGLTDDDGADDDTLNDDDGADDDTPNDDDGADDDLANVVFTDIDDLCDAYCAEVNEACTAEDRIQQYSSVTACRTVCSAAMALGEPGDDGVDTAYCRFENSRNVGIFGEVEEDCAGAGLGGNDACGPICEVYCDLLAAACSEASTVEDVTIVHDHEACITECEQLPRTPDPFQFEVTSGNSLECRLWHVQAAFGTATTHCPHAVGLALCVP